MKCFCCYEHTVKTAFKVVVRDLERVFLGEDSFPIELVMALGKGETRGPGGPSSLL